MFESLIKLRIKISILGSTTLKECQQHYLLLKAVFALFLQGAYYDKTLLPNSPIA
jgi:hypothetical protein